MPQSAFYLIFTLQWMHWGSVSWSRMFCHADWTLLSYSYQYGKCILRKWMRGNPISAKKSWKSAETSMSLKSDAEVLQDVHSAKSSRGWDLQERPRGGPFNLWAKLQKTLQGGFGLRGLICGLLLGCNLGPAQPQVTWCLMFRPVNPMRIFLHTIVENRIKCKRNMGNMNSSIFRVFLTQPNTEHKRAPTCHSKRPHP